MKTLHLTLRKKWFDMIASGEKKEEYRDIKMYWAVRLMNGFPSTYGIDFLNPDFKEFDMIEFKNGYSKSSAMMRFKFGGITIGEGMMVWGAEKCKQYFIIKIGEPINQI